MPKEEKAMKLKTCATADSRPALIRPLGRLATTGIYLVLLVIAIPYGSDPAPPGDGHSFSNIPDDGSKCPR